MSHFPPAPPTRKNGTDLAPSVLPVWMRLPKHGTNCQYTGLSRSFLFALLRDNRVKSKTISTIPGGRGVRLIQTDSLFALLDSQPYSIPGTDDSDDE